MKKEAIPDEYKRLVEEYVALLKRHFGSSLSSVCLFGSVARGCAALDSDIDILVVASGIPEEAGIKETSYIHEKLRSPDAYSSIRGLGKSDFISDIFFTPDEIERCPPILLDIVEDGIILYDKGGFLRNVLLSMKERHKKLGARKIITKKGYYWVLKPDIKPGEIVRI